MLAVYAILSISILGNIAYFVYSTQADHSGNWTRYGFVPAICFGLFALAAIMAFVMDMRATPEVKQHTSSQLKIVFALLIGGILSAIQTSAQWLLESDVLTGILNILLIAIVIFVIARLIMNVVMLLWTTVGAQHADRLAAPSGPAVPPAEAPAPDPTT